MILHLEWFWVLDCEGCCVWSLDAVATGFCMILYFSFCTIHDRVKSCISFVCALQRVAFGPASVDSWLDYTWPYSNSQVHTNQQRMDTSIPIQCEPIPRTMKKALMKMFRASTFFIMGGITMINNEANSSPKYHPSTNKKFVCNWLCPEHIFCRHLHHMLCLWMLVGRF